MKTTVNININRTAFIIDEDAHIKLKNYLSTIEGHFKASEGRNEIMEDIEARISELLHGRINSSSQVVTLTDVDYIIDTMGKPEEYSDGETYDETEKNNQQANTGSGFSKKIYRDTDQRFLGGVCAGIGHYFSVDKVWIRLAFVILVVFAGLSVIPYIILWVIIPAANTTAEKLEMKGEKPDYSNIGKAVENEIHAVKSSISNFAERNDVAATAKSIIEKLSKIFLAFFGITFTVVGLSILFPFCLSVMGDMAFLSVGPDGINSIDKKMSIMILDGNHSCYFWLGISLLLLSLSALFITVGTKLLIRFKQNIGWIVGLCVITFISAIVLIIIPSASAAKELTTHKEYKEEIIIPTNSKVLSLTSNSSENIEGEEIIFEENFFVFRDQETSIVGYPTLKIEESNSDSLIILKVIKHARGASRRDALNRAKDINYTFNINNDTINLSPFYTFTNVWRVQELELIIQVPEGTIVNKDEYVNLFLEETIAKRIDKEVIQLDF